MIIANAKNKPGRGFISRAEDKLFGAVRGFGFDFRHKTVLDIGSSTGGFTDLALKLGAKKVIAVEKGTHQMKAPLRFDKRVELHEKTDIFEFPLEFDFDVVVADVSFVSLREVLSYVKNKVTLVQLKNLDFLVMLKPQFEANPEQLVKGIVKNEKIRRDLIQNFEQWLKNNGFLIIKKRDNDIKGAHGNLERFYYLKIAK